MKKAAVLLSLVSLFMMHTSLSAQNFTYGVAGGFDVAKILITNKPEGYSDYMINLAMASYNVNGYVGYKFNTQWGVALEPGYMQKGGRLKGAGEKVRCNLNYLQLPLTVAYYFTEKLHASLGPEFSYMVSAKIKYDSGATDIYDWFDHAFEVSALVGCSYQIINNVEIGLRFCHGLNAISKITWTDAYGTTTGESKEYNQYYQLMVRYVF